MFPIICPLCVLCVSVVKFLIPQMIAIRCSTTEAQRAQRGKGKCKGPVWFRAFWLRLCRAGNLQSQRDCVLQPRVARDRAVREAKPLYLLFCFPLGYAPPKFTTPTGLRPGQLLPAERAATLSGLYSPGFPKVVRPSQPLCRNPFGIQPAFARHASPARMSCKAGNSARQARKAARSMSALITPSAVPASATISP